MGTSGSEGGIRIHQPQNWAGAAVRPLYPYDPSNLADHHSAKKLC